MATGSAPQQRRKAVRAVSATADRSERRRSGQVQSLARAISLLNALTDEDYGLSLSDLAQKVGLAPSTTHRLLTTLQEERFVRFDLERNVWLVGVQAFVVGNAFVRSRDLINMSRPHMRNLMEDSGETVNLAVEDQGEAIYLGQVECRQMMRAIAKPGGRVALHCSGVGKALLSGLPDSEVNKIVQRRGLGRFTDKTIDTPAKLRQALSLARKQGYAFDDEENAIGLRCVAAVIYDEYGHPLAGLSLSGPTARMPDARVSVLGALVVKAAGEITTALGGAVPDFSNYG
ncbi:IclR family transcriptional regulator C-terminal domain-containing protein [Pelagibius sp. Alg239-R121]|uniref:IclR family transcriptional regulator domain-containing protein n=1 Tax=Pelagibius sp. Alg239-R121 TaxID=2993448 RepID=UPI0024A6E24F|nr:IclR family transcriptional regulator C-terminal domain-containing protein [Pelagibius sp. Alg239-R121]